MMISALRLALRCPYFLKGILVVSPKDYPVSFSSSHPLCIDIDSSVNTSHLCTTSLAWPWPLLSLTSLDLAFSALDMSCVCGCVCVCQCVMCKCVLSAVYLE